MAPEVLELHRNKTRAALNSIESYKRADIYSFGLVVWELCMGTYMGTSTPKELPKEVRFVTYFPIFHNGDCMQKATKIYFFRSIKYLYATHNTSHTFKTIKLLFLKLL